MTIVYFGLDVVLQGWIIESLCPWEGEKLLRPKISLMQANVEKQNEQTSRVAYYFRYWKETFFSICIFGALQFLVMTIVASFFYTGGSHLDPYYNGYTFVWNYVSDLGRTYSLSGNKNLISRIMFSSTVTIAGLSVILYCVAFTHNFKLKTIPILRIIPLIFGILYGLDYILIAYLPVDIFTTAHNFCVLLSCFLKLVTYIFLIVLMIKDQGYSNIYAYILIFQSVLLLLFGIVMLFALRNIIPFTPTCITGQKVLFYLEAVIFTIQAFGALRYKDQ